MNTPQDHLTELAKTREARKKVESAKHSKELKRLREESSRLPGKYKTTRSNHD